MLSYINTEIDRRLTPSECRLESNPALLGSLTPYTQGKFEQQLKKTPFVQ